MQKANPICGPPRRIVAAALAILLAAPAAAQWVTFEDHTASRVDADANLVVNDPDEKDYAWGDVDRDGDGLNDDAESLTDDPDCDGIPEIDDPDETDGPCAETTGGAGGSGDVITNPKDEGTTCGCDSNRGGLPVAGWLVALGVVALRRRQSSR